ncbi:MAG: tetratricopeptide repeat protein [Flavobacteriaceae bacterium]|nr:tetratricopeptide repeat protein [Flavobacteriaceae bacterium]
MIKILRIFFLGILFVLPSKITAISSPKGEAEFISASPLSIVQEKDSLFKIRYLEIKNLYKKQEYSSSLEKGLILLEDVHAVNNIELEYLCTFLIGDIFNEVNNHKKALQYFQKALQFLEDKKSINFDDISFYDSLFQPSQQFADNLLRIGSEFYWLEQKDSATYYYEKIIGIETLDNSVSKTKALAYGNLSGFYMQDSLYDLAKSYAMRAAQIHQKNNNKASEAAALGNLASIYLVLNDHIKAKEIYSTALNLVEKDSSSSAVKYKEKLYYNLAWTLYLLKDYTAYDYQEKSYLIKDNLRDKEIRRIVEEVYANHEVDLVKNQVELKKLNDRKLSWLFSAIIFLVLIVSTVVLYNYRLRQKNLKLLLRQNKLAQRSNLERLKSESQIRILNATLDGKESERKQIAETLHDSVSTLLSSASMHLQASKTQFNGNAPVEIDKSQKIITEASQKIRDLSHTLVSSILLKFGLRFAIKDMAEKYSNSQIEFNSEIKNIRRYRQSFEIKVNNIIEEFVNNVIKHSNASNALIVIIEEDEKLHIAIEDNGDGFDKKIIAQKDGLGINQIEARIHMMKGVFVIDSKKGKGTKIKVVLPILEKKVASRV